MSQRPPRLPAVMVSQPGGLPVDGDVLAEKLGDRRLTALLGGRDIEALVLARVDVEERERLIRVGRDPILPDERISPSGDFVDRCLGRGRGGRAADTAADGAAAEGATDPPAVEHAAATVTTPPSSAASPGDLVHGLSPWFVSRRFLPNPTLSHNQRGRKPILRSRTRRLGRWESSSRARRPRRARWSRPSARGHVRVGLFEHDRA